MVNGWLKRPGFLNNVHDGRRLLALVIREQKRRKRCVYGHFAPAMVALRDVSGEPRQN
jgi:hypothetical protein